MDRQTKAEENMLNEISGKDVFRGAGLWAGTGSDNRNQ